MNSAAAPEKMFCYQCGFTRYVHIQATKVANKIQYKIVAEHATNKTDDWIKPVWSLCWIDKSPQKCQESDPV